ncbi:Rieske 2Fe-2S domain-containing protein [bacterium]|nr:Rieske 2Fe-2S domain-containing protein [bacterium]
MSKHVVARVEDIGPGERRVVTVRNRPIVIFNLDGEFFGLLNRCPHQAASLSQGIQAGFAIAEVPGTERCIRRGEFIRCPWHGWEYDIRTGQSWCDPESILVRRFKVERVPGSELVKGPFVAETVEVSTDEEYIYVEA